MTQSPNPPITQSPNEQGVSVSAHRYQLIPRVLCFVTHGEDVLLIKGTPTKKIWPNRYNGLGGHVERDETTHATAVREIKEESGLDVENLRLCGVITIDTGEATGIGLYVYHAVATQREFVASEEGGLEWVPTQRLADYPCVPDVPILISRILAMRATDGPFSARYYYVKDKLEIEFFH